MFTIMVKINKKYGDTLDILIKKYRSIKLFTCEQSQT